MLNKLKTTLYNFPTDDEGGIRFAQIQDTKDILFSSFTVAVSLSDRENTLSMRRVGLFCKARSVDMFGNRVGFVKLKSEVLDCDLTYLAAAFPSYFAGN